MHRRAIALAVPFALVIGCVAASGPAPAAAVEIEIKGFTFAPAQVEVPAGTTVTWVNRDDILHTATSGTTRSSGLGTYDASPDGRFAGRMDGAGTRSTFRFTEPGTYPYFCDRHRHMTATVVVR